MEFESDSIGKESYKKAQDHQMSRSTRLLDLWILVRRSLATKEKTPDFEWWSSYIFDNLEQKILQVNQHQQWSTKSKSKETKTMSRDDVGNCPGLTTYPLLSRDWVACLFGLVNFLLLLVLLASKLLDEVWWYWVHAASPDKKKKERSRLCHHLLA